jgi:hypothetical protein
MMCVERQIVANPLSRVWVKTTFVEPERRRTHIVEVLILKSGRSRTRIFVLLMTQSRNFAIPKCFEKNHFCNVCPGPQNTCLSVPVSVLLCCLLIDTWRAWSRMPGQRMYGRASETNVRTYYFLNSIWKFFYKPRPVSKCDRRGGGVVQLRDDVQGLCAVHHHLECEP